jgi:hypothetical protein
MTVLELGCGVTPDPRADVHHDRIRHDAHVDVAHDLEELPWPWEDDAFEEIVALDVFEHLDLARRGLPWWAWLDECWRILPLAGVLTMRLPAWDNPSSWRDPTHVRPWSHPETFHYWDPCRELWRDFGRIYPLADVRRWWHVRGCVREQGDLRFELVKVGEEHIPSGPPGAGREEGG